jgi:predicted ATPase
MRDVCDLIGQHRLVTLVGPGGTGKTRLLLRVAEEKLDQFPQGVWFAELAGLSNPELVPRTILSVFGLQESPNRSFWSSSRITCTNGSCCCCWITANT